MEGYIKLHRKLKENPIYTNSKAVHVWIECLLRASHKEITFYSKRNKVTLKAGQFLFGRDKFAAGIGMSGSTAWYWLLQFEVDSMVDITRSRKGSIVTINQWDKYQGVDNTVDQKKTQNKLKKNSNKNVKNVKNIYAPKKNFLENTEAILKEASEKYPDKDCSRVMEEFIEGITNKNYKYRDYYKAYLDWIEDSNYTNPLNYYPNYV